MRRFFLAHPKDMDDEILGQYRRAAHDALEPLAMGAKFTITLGRDHYNENAKRAGSWDAWALEVAVGKNYLTREPTFDAILVPEGLIGAATAKIVQHALEVNKPVVMFTLSGSCRKIVGIDRTDPRNWKTGWVLKLAP